MYFFRKFKKPAIIIVAILVIFFVFSQTSFGKRIFLEAGILEAVRDFLDLNGDELSAADYKDGTILLIKPVATGVGEGRYEAGDIVEIRDGEEMYRRFGNGNFLGKEERTMLLPLYYPGKLTEEQKRELIEPEVQEISNDQKTEMKNEKMVMRRKMGVDYTQFLSDSEILKVRNLEKLKKLPEIDLSAIIQKNGGQSSVIEMPKSLAKIESARNTIKKLAGKIIPFVFAQVSETVKIVDTGGAGDYISLNAWEAAQEGDITAGASGRNEIAIAKCRATTGAADTTAVTVGTGWVTDADHYIKIWTDPAEGYRHNGKWDTGKYRLQINAVWTTVLTVNENNVRIEGLQVYNSSISVGAPYEINLTGEATGPYDFRISHNILRAVSGSGGRGILLSRTASDLTLRAWNNIIYDCQYGIISNYGQTGALIFYNNTIIDSSTVGISAGRDSPAAGTFRLKNNLVQGSAMNYYESFSYWGTLDTSNNISEDATSPNTAFRNKVVVFADEANDDFHLRLGDSAARGASANLRADANLAFSDDIDGQQRPETGVWDIGADEVARTTQINTPLSGRFIDSSLVGYWSFDGADMNATTAIDRSGNNNNGDVRNGAQKVPGINGQALKFDGVDDYVNADPVANDIATGNFSVSAWIKFPQNYTSASPGRIVFRNGDPSSSNDINFQFGRWTLYPTTGKAGAFNFLVYSGSAWAIASSSQISWTANTWYHIAGTFSTTNGMVAYVNGISQDTNSNTSRGANASTHTDIGCSYPGSINPDYFSGLIDEVRVYNRALSTDEILELYRLGTRKFQPTQ